MDFCTLFSTLQANMTSDTIKLYYFNQYFSSRIKNIIPSFKYQYDFFFTNVKKTRNEACKCKPRFFVFKLFYKCTERFVCGIKVRFRDKLVRRVH